jgi:penicillin-binding protein 1A
MALAKSLNTIAAELSFAVGREKVIEMTQRLGIKGIRKTCSMALGDYGITPLEHTGGLAVFANGGRRATPYAIIDLVTARGELVYNRERDEPEPEQIVKPEVAAMLNQMLNKVVTDGTGGAAKLDFTNSAGKTGTSTGPKDVWFVGFTGKYVASVWLGNDDNRPMASGNTGGHMAAPVWHDFMSVAHTDMNIPTIPGLAPHPVQLAEQQRIAELKQSDPAAAAALAGAGGERQATLMPQATKEALSKIGVQMRKAAGLPEPEPSAPPPTDPVKKGASLGVPPRQPGAAAAAPGTSPVTTSGLGGPDAPRSPVE